MHPWPAKPFPFWSYDYEITIWDISNTASFTHIKWISALVRSIKFHDTYKGVMLYKVWPPWLWQIILCQNLLSLQVNFYTDSFHVWCVLFIIWPAPLKSTVATFTQIEYHFYKPCAHVENVSLDITKVPHNENLSSKWYPSELQTSSVWSFPIKLTISL